jgi:hypothetical protein
MSIEDAREFKMRKLIFYENFFTTFINQCVVLLENENLFSNLHYLIDSQKIQVLNEHELQNNVLCGTVNLHQIINTNVSLILNNMCDLNVNKIFNKIKETTSNINATPTYVFKINNLPYLNEHLLRNFHNSFSNLISINNSNERSKLKICKINSNKFYYIIIFIDNLEINELLEYDGFVFKNHDKIEHFFINENKKINHENDNEYDYLM